MKNPEEIDKLVDKKFLDAELLIEHAESINNSRYLAGYAIELALKAKICRHLDVPDLFSKEQVSKNDVSSPFRSHNLSSLMIYAGLHGKHSEALNDDTDYYKKWQLVSNWKPSLRYNTQYCDRSKCMEFLKAVNFFIQWIRDN